MPASATVVPHDNDPTQNNTGEYNIPMPWNGKYGGISFDKVFIPTGFQLHRIRVNYSIYNENDKITGGTPTNVEHVTYPFEPDYNNDIGTDANDSSLQNISLDSINLEDSISINNDIILVCDALYAGSPSWYSFKVKSARTVDHIPVTS